jgi:hypothetical protein
MSANPTNNRFRRKALPRESLDAGIPSTRSTVRASARRGAVVRRQIGRPILVCRWVAVDGGLECRWSIEVSDGSPLEEPNPFRIGRFFDVKRSRYRQAVAAVA